MITVMPNVTKKLKLEQQDPGEEPRNLDRDSPIPLKNLGNTCYENSIIQCLFNLNMFMDNFEMSMERMRRYVIKPELEPIAMTLDCVQEKQLNLADDQDGQEERLHQEQGPEQQQQQQQQHEEDEQQQQVDQDTKIEACVSPPSTTINETDVRYRIANAFDNLWKSYTKKRNQIETNNQNNRLCKSTSIESHQNLDLTSPTTPTIVPTPSTSAATICSSTDLAIKKPFEAIPLCKPIATVAASSQVPAPAADDLTNPTTTENDSSTATTSITSAANLTPIALMSSSSGAPTNEQSEIETRLEDLKSAVGERSSQFNSALQQDASEFFYHVIDSIQEFYQSLNKTKDDDNPVTKAFELELDYSIRCPKCHHQTMTEPEKIRTLPLALPHVNNQVTSNSETNTTAPTPNEFINGTNGAPTPPTSDLGLDSPESNSFDEQKNGSDEKENNNQALVEEEMRCEDNNSSNTTVSNNTMSIAKLDLTDNIEMKLKGNQASTKDSNEENQQENKPPTSPSQQQQQPQSNSNQSQPQKHYTLNDALNNYFKDDILECNCSQDNCDSKQRTKKCFIRKLPQVLFITLARYSYTGKKNLDEIEAPFELSVPFRENKSPSHSPSAHSKFENYDCNNYQLVAVVCHLGSSLNAGHYTSYVYNQNNFSWYSCDDDSITKVQEADVKSDATKSGYCFFYAHTSCINQKSDEISQTNLVTKTTNTGEYLAQMKEKDAIVVPSNVPDSSVVLTPESSPKSSPSRTSKIPEETVRDHTCCMDDNYIDDWS